MISDTMLPPLLKKLQLKNMYASWQEIAWQADRAYALDSNSGVK
jgi:hypothetical protein